MSLLSRIKQVNISLQTVIWIYFYSICGFTLIMLSKNFLKGGNSWKQGDWLINSNLIEIRRGLFGSFVLGLSDILHASPLLVVILLQACLFLILAFTIKKILTKEGSDSIVTWLILTPFFVLIFWGNDPQGSFRKELLTYASIALLILTQLTETKMHPYIKGCAVALFIAGELAHEINLLLAPAFLFVLYYSVKEKNLREFIGWATPVIIAGIFSAQYTLSHPAISDINSVCLPLTDRGLSEGICDGAIKWLTFSTADAQKTVQVQLAKGGLLYFFAFYIAATLVVSRVAQKAVRPIWVWAVFIAAAIPIIPLYFLAIDYGRWMSLHFTVFTLCIIAMKYAGSLQPLRLVSRAEMKWMLILAPIFSPSHILGRSDSGVILGILLGFLLYYLFHIWRESRRT